MNDRIISAFCQTVLLAVVLILPGLAMLIAPDRFARAFNTIARKLTGSSSFLSEEYARRNGAGYRIAGAMFCLMGGIIIGQILRQATSSSASGPARPHAAVPVFRWPGDLILFFATAIMLVVAINPQFAARFLRWEKYMDPELLGEPYFYRTMRCVGILGLSFLIATLLSGLLG
jgi:hypothetical protein